MTDRYDLGSYSRAITTQSAEAQAWFDQGLMWTYGFNHEQAIRCFEAALEHDPTCAMAHWGIAYALTPNYNQVWDDFPPRQRRDCVARMARHLEAARAAPASAVEQALIAALEHKRPADAELEDFAPLTDAYAEAMAQVCAEHGEDLDVVAFYAEALITRTPWKLWDLQSGAPAAGASTTQAMELLERAFERDAAWSHPGVLHMYIHLMEMSPHPEKALRMGDALYDLVPDAGHLQHMPSHIDVLCGNYADVVARNQRAWEADQIFLDRMGPKNFYTSYICHDLHFKLYGAMFLGQFKPAIEAAEALETLLPAEVIEPVADWMESYVPMRVHALIRFGRWEDLLALELYEDVELYIFSNALILYGRALAAAALGRVDEARAVQVDFEAARAAVPESRMLFNNRCIDILQIAATMLEGEIAYRAGDFDQAFATLRQAVALDDGLPYEEPWGWMQPTRHALGALLLEQGQVAEAEAVYRADLGLDDTLARASQHPGNVWALHGLHECLTRGGKDAEAAIIAPQLTLARARADVPIEVSCFCRRLGK